MSVTLHTTLGDIKIEVFCESVPKTAENFLALCASSFYTNSPFHRSFPTFIVQTGSPATSTTTGSTTKPSSTSTSTSIWQQPFEDEIRPSLRHHTRGIVSMANKGPNTNGSQFFITYGPAAHLNGLNTVFGRVIGEEGMGTLDRLEACEVDAKGRMKGERVLVERVTVHANPLAG